MRFGSKRKRSSKAATDDDELPVDDRPRMSHGAERVARDYSPLVGFGIVFQNVANIHSRRSRAVASAGDDDDAALVNDRATFKMTAAFREISERRPAFRGWVVAVAIELIHLLLIMAGGPTTTLLERRSSRQLSS